MENKIKFMRAAIQEAKKCLEIDEVPVGCVIVFKDKIISRAHNLRETKKNAVCHAEILAIQKACKKLDAWRLEDCELYVTIEPCIMCGGAIIQSRISKIYYGAKDLKGGSFGTSIDILQAKNINHHPEIEGGILEKECAELITNYFKSKRILKNK